MSAGALLEFCERLGDSWEGLADVLGISPADRARFEQGNQARRIVVWLTERRRLPDLVSAVEEIDRADLIGVVAEIVRAAEDDSVRRRRLALPRSVQQFEILFLSTHPDLQHYESVLRAAVDIMNSVALTPTTSCRFHVNSWDADVHAIGSSEDGMGFYSLSAVSDTVVVVIRRSPSADALATLRALLEAETTRAFVLVFPDAEGEASDTAQNLNAMRERHRDAVEWINLSVSAQQTEQAVAQVTTAIVCRLVLEIVTTGPSDPASYFEKR
ncbi:death domain-containing protein [Mycobacterium marinum]|uniref:death domain-containing protein n=1 Tax=Mycobacterium marinum TaxID=1781 RepID=UPI002358C1EB|nr:death domain-containing protein [Mycobacterium marinum]MDC9005234.1 death domain-containing protein [Mycobacterium marinum]